MKSKEVYKQQIGEIIAGFNDLNEEGRRKVCEYIKDLKGVENEKYTRRSRRAQSFHIVRSVGAAADQGQHPQGKGRQIGQK